MLAIPVLRSRVAPVFDWCSRIRIFPLQPSPEEAGQELYLPNLEADQRLRVLGDKGVTTLICGALSAELRLCARRLNMNIICGVAGEISDVLKSYWQNRLDQPRFWLPGCRGARRYRDGLRQGGLCRRQAGQGASSRQTFATEGLEHVCRCPACGATAEHTRGIPCAALTCPRCGQAMVRG